MPKERFTWTEPALCHYGHDLARDWFVYFTYSDTLTKRKKRIQKRGGINYYKDKEGRLKQGNAYVQFWKKKLDAGWNPFVSDDVKKLPIHYNLSEALERILALKMPSLRKRAKETYTYVHKAFAGWLKEKNLCAIETAEFQNSAASEYMDYLILVKGYAGRTHNDHLIILKTFFNDMIARKWINDNPFKGIKRKPVEVGRNHAYTDAEREMLKNYLYTHDRRMYYFSQIMYYCFIRRSELARLRVSAFDLANNSITIPADVSKNKCQESVVIPMGLEPVLKEMQLHTYDREDYIFGRELKTGPRVYTNYNHISTRHNDHVSDVGLNKAKGLYSWKHTGVCVAYYATGKDIYAVMRQLRHRDLNTTQIYLKSLGLIQNDVFRTAMVG